MAIWGPTAKFNSRQYFQLYGMSIYSCLDDIIYVAKKNPLLLMYARPLRDDEVLPVRRHRIVPSAAMATEEGELEVSE